MINKEYITELSEHDKEFTRNSAVHYPTKDSIHDYFKNIIKSLDCSRWDKAHKFRLMQTIGYDYKYMISQCLYLINVFNLDDEYKNMLEQRHSSNLSYEATSGNPSIVYDKKKGLKVSKEKKTKREKPTVSKAELKLRQSIMKLSGLKFNIKSK